MQLKVGDVFCTSSPNILGDGIRFITRILSKDGKSVYNHAGIIISTSGYTFEALWKIRSNHINAYKGKKMVIYRPVERIDGGPVHPGMIDNAIEQIIFKYSGESYPVHRLAGYIFFAPFLKYFAGDAVVCSELVAHYEKLIKVYPGEHGGVTPDDLVDRWWIARTHEFVFEGKWEGV